MLVWLVCLRYFRGAKGDNVDRTEQSCGGSHWQCDAGSVLGFIHGRYFRRSERRRCGPHRAKLRQQRLSMRRQKPSIANCWSVTLGSSSGSTAGASAGNHILNVVPSPGTVSTSNRPPCIFVTTS
ncbi:hypothetical protein Pan14r_04890 [Crateriforma conspicua]|uniref:Uncharacterized protein n=1 Tax=Crateriforma conspicua TaxID=2527996 RepID=A0A5C5Y1R2_9PLAN|nr:hypothetical protein Pan14r_04890 [Crateriforma conspicua]